MRIKTNLYLMVALLVGVLTMSSCVTPPVEKTVEPVYMPTLTEGGFSDQILKKLGPAIVLFHDNTFAPSKRLLGLAESRAKRYYGQIRFYSFVWPTDKSGEVYDLEILPTLVYFNDGKELDRMKGLPASFDNQQRIVPEFDLWLQRTVLDKPAKLLSGEYKYRYNNTPTLQVSNF